MPFIDKENTVCVLDNYAQALYQQNNWKMGETVDNCKVLVEEISDEYVIPIEQYNRLNFKCNVLRALLKGEWVHCKDAQEALDITFDQGMKMFQFGVEGTWPPSIDNVSFRISEQTIAQTKIKDFEEDFKLQELLYRSKVDAAVDNLELILEQHGGIL